ncbi:hypothetical protein M0P98_08865, partial [bacterium]|nr:hypothetical protein [bacterium]
LQVLAIKYLQSQFIPLNEIKKLLKEIKEEQMEQLLTKEEKLLSPKMLAPLGGAGLISPIAGILAALGTTYLLKKKNGAKKEEPSTSVKWLHIPIIDKVELNIQEDYLPENAKDRDEFIDRLIARIRIYLQGEESKWKEEK